MDEGKLGNMLVFFFFFGLGLIEWIAGTVEDNCRQRKLVFWNELVN